MKKQITLALLALLLIGCSNSSASNTQKNNSKPITSETSASQSKSEKKNKSDAFRTGKDLVADGIHQVIKKDYYIGDEKSPDETNYDKSQLDAFLADKETTLKTSETTYDDDGYTSSYKIDGIKVNDCHIDGDELICHRYDGDGKDLGVSYIANFKTLELTDYALDEKSNQYTDDISSVTVYDKTGKKQQVADTDGYLEEYSYDKDGNLYQETVSLDGEKIYTLTYTYDEFGNELNGQVETEYEIYNALAFEYQNSQTDKDGNRTYTELYNADNQATIMETTYEGGREKTLLFLSETGKIIEYIEMTYK